MREGIRHPINTRKSLVVISIIIGKDKTIAIRGTSSVFNRVTYPSFFRFFFDKGRVCSHLNALPVIKELTLNIPRRKTYKIKLIKSIPKIKLKVNITVLSGFKYILPSLIMSKYAMREIRGKNINKNAKTNFNI
jgi:hypothetical protein